MNKRFQIEDIIIQDAAGVTFRAIDSETRKPVAVRRFFPFGVDGGGLHKEEEVAYKIAITRLAGVRHPSLRAVITGGCDPIDAIPFIATEWVEGDLLSEIIAKAPLSALDAAEIVSKTLEVSELLSHELAEEAIWVETELNTIVVGNADSARGTTFWISPLKWLGGTQTRGYNSIVTLVENLMGWRDQIVGDQAGRGLGGWIKWLRTTPATTPLREIRESLAAIIGAEPPVVIPEKSGTGLVSRTPTGRITTRPMAQSPSVLLAPAAKPLSKTPWLIGLGALFAAVAAGLVWWLITHPAPMDESSTDPSKHLTELERVNLRAAELKAEFSSRNPPSSARPAPPLKGVIPWNQRDAVIAQAKRVITVSGTVTAISQSNSGKTLYLLFSDNELSTRVGLLVEDDKREENEKQFRALSGKSIEATGKVRYSKSIGNRPEIIIDSMSGIKTVD